MVAGHNHLPAAVQGTLILRQGQVGDREEGQGRLVFAGGPVQGWDQC